VLEILRLKKSQPIWEKYARARVSLHSKSAPSKSMATLFEMEPLRESGLKTEMTHRRRRHSPTATAALVIAGAEMEKRASLRNASGHLLASDVSLTGEGKTSGLAVTTKAAGEMRAGRKRPWESGPKSYLKDGLRFARQLLKDVDSITLMLDKVGPWICCGATETLQLTATADLPRRASS